MQLNVQTSLARPAGDTWETELISDETLDLDGTPGDDEVADALRELRGAREDGEGVAYRRVYIGQDSDGNFTEILRDTTLDPDLPRATRRRAR